MNALFGGIPPPHFFFRSFSNGGYWAGFWRVLGEFSASSWRILVEIWALDPQPWSKKLGPDGSQGRPKSIKKQGIFGHGFREAPECANGNIFPPIWAPCWPNLGAKSVECSCYFLAWSLMDFWRLLAAFWEAFWWIFGGLFWYFCPLCGKSRTPRIYFK